MLRALIPTASVRKVGEARSFTRKTGQVVNSTDVFIEDSTGEPLTVSFDHNKLSLPKRGDLVDLEVDVNAFSAQDSFNIRWAITVVDWAPSNGGPDLS